MDDETRKIIAELAKQRASLGRCIARTNAVRALFWHARDAHREALVKYLNANPDETHTSIANKFQVAEGTVRYHARKNGTMAEEKCKGMDSELSK
jgi:hypothetical protein